MPFVPMVYRAQVEAVTELGSGMRALSLGGPGLQGWRSTGTADEWVHLGAPGGSRLYTVRAHQAAPVRVRLEVSLHSSGPAARWAGAAGVGDEVTISQPVGRYAPPPDTSWQLIVADHAGLPGAARIVEAAPPEARLLVCLVLDDPQDYPWPVSAADVTVHRLVERDPDRAGHLLAEAARSLSWPDGPGYVWLAAETDCARGMRRHLRRELGWPSERYAVVGYWQRRAGDYDRRYAVVADRVAELFDRGQRCGVDPEDVLLEVEELLDHHGL